MRPGLTKYVPPQSGGLVLGFGFLWSDILAYCIGVSAGYLIEKTFLRAADYDQ